MKEKQKSPTIKRPLKFSWPNQSAGFTIIELLVVISIMGIFLSLILVNFARNRGVRDLRISYNELTTNIRKVQSYVLASRDTSVGPAKYYVLKFDKAMPSQYMIEAIQTNGELTTPIETIKLPSGVTISSIALQQPIGTGVSPDPNCIQVGFAMPFNKIYADQDCAIDLLVRDTGNLSNFDDSLITITLRESQGGSTRTVTINGVTGLIY
jgi:prepilin-type N-terminal cleavage/methylation domain-containing protein